jgi:hypothetical protein
MRPKTAMMRKWMINIQYRSIGGGSEQSKAEESDPEQGGNSIYMRGAPSMLPVELPELGLRLHVLTISVSARRAAIALSNDSHQARREAIRRRQRHRLGKVLLQVKHNVFFRRVDVVAVCPHTQHRAKFLAWNKQNRADNTKRKIERTEPPSDKQ